MFSYYSVAGSCGSTDDIVTGLHAGLLRNCGAGDFIFLQIMRTDFGACPAVYLVSSGVLSLGVKWLDLKAGRTAPYGAEVKNIWCCSLTVKAFVVAHRPSNAYIILLFRFCHQGIMYMTVYHKILWHVLSFLLFVHLHVYVHVCLM